MLMTPTLVVMRIFIRVKVINVNVAQECGSGKHVTTGSEFELPATLDWKCLIVFDARRKHVHQHNFVVESDHNLETARVECHSLCFFTSRTRIHLLKRFFGIVPNADAFMGSSNDELLPKTNVHTRDPRSMEKTMNWGPLKGLIH